MTTLRWGEVGAVYEAPLPNLPQAHRLRDRRRFPFLQRTLPPDRPRQLGHRKIRRLLARFEEEESDEEPSDRAAQRIATAISMNPTTDGWRRQQAALRARRRHQPRSRLSAEGARHLGLADRRAARLGRMLVAASPRTPTGWLTPLHAMVGGRISPSSNACWPSPFPPSASGPPAAWRRYLHSNDPQIVVIDEVAGQLIAYLGLATPRTIRR